MNWADSYQVKLELQMRLRERLAEAERWNLVQMAKASAEPAAGGHGAVARWRRWAQQARHAWGAWVCGLRGMVGAQERAC